MAGNTRAMAEARQTKLGEKKDSLAPSFIKAKKALYAYLAESELDEAANEIEEYSSCMQEAKKLFKKIRMTVNEIDPEDHSSKVVDSIMENWSTYVSMYKSLVKNFGKAQTFRKDRLKVEQDKEKDKEKEEERKMKLAMEEMKNQKEIYIKKLKLEATNASISSDNSAPGTSTPISRSSPTPTPTRGWMSIPACRSSIYPFSLLCNLCGGGR